MVKERGFEAPFARLVRQIVHAHGPDVVAAAGRARHEYLDVPVELVLAARVFAAIGCALGAVDLAAGGGREHRELRAREELRERRSGKDAAGELLVHPRVPPLDHVIGVADHDTDREAAADVVEEKGLERQGAWLHGADSAEFEQAGFDSRPL
jgi:hypothetical protein